MRSLIQVSLKYVAQHVGVQVVLSRWVSANSSEDFPAFEGMDRQPVLLVA